MRERGHAAVELGLAVGLLLLPVAVAVLAFGPWSERRVLAEAAAAEAARAAVIALDVESGSVVVADMASNHGLAEGMVRLGWCGSTPTELSAPGAGCGFERGTEVTAEVQVWVPLMVTPWGEVGGLWVGAAHSEPIDLYRSLR
ncbi:MAG: hypothetical protein ACRDZM_10030 [Acidimicrobiia bacterium]